MAKKKYRSDQWFYPARGSYLPRTWQAWMLYAVALLLVLTSFGYDLANDVALLPLLIGFVTKLILTGCALTLVAQKKS